MGLKPIHQTYLGRSPRGQPHNCHNRYNQTISPTENRHASQRIPAGHQCPPIRSTDHGSQDGCCVPAGKGAVQKRCDSSWSVSVARAYVSGCAWRFADDARMVCSATIGWFLMSRQANALSRRSCNRKVPRVKSHANLSIHTSAFLLLALLIG